MKIPLRTNDGRVVAELDTETGTVYKKVRASTHMLQIPKAWTYDRSVIYGIHDWIDSQWKKSPIQPDITFVIYAEDQDKTYRLDWVKFQFVAYLMKWRQDNRYEQWVIPLKHWSIDGERHQLSLF